MVDNSHTPCDKLMDPHAVHAELCGIGPARQRAHKALARKLGWCLKRTGANVDYERVAPHLYRWDDRGVCEEAYMDVWVSWPGSFSNCKVDVTVRSPFAGRYKHAASRPAVAADAGAGDKERRYGPEVWVLNFESRGRLGSQGMELLQHLAAESHCWSASGLRRRPAFRERGWSAR